MNAAEVAGVVAVVLGALTAFLAATGQLSAERRKNRTDRGRESSGDAAVLLASWKDLGDSITAEVERVKKSCIEEIAKLKAEHEADRAEWHAERAAMHEEIETLKAQVLGLLSLSKRPATSRTRQSDKETP